MTNTLFKVGTPVLCFHFEPYPPFETVVISSLRIIDGKGHVLVAKVGEWVPIDNLEIIIE